MQQCLLRLVRFALQADGAALIAPQTDLVGECPPWPQEEVLAQAGAGAVYEPNRLIRSVSNGALIVWTEVERDWTEHQLRTFKKFAQELEPHVTREGMLESVVDGSDAVISIKDQDGRYLEVNPAAARLFGRQREAILGLTDRDLLPSRFASPLQTNDQRVLDEGVTLKVEEIIPDGDRVATWLSLKFPLILGGQTMGVCGISTDVTERISMATKLARTRERLDLALEGVGLGLWMCDLPFDALEWNDRCKKHFGLPPDASVDIDTFFRYLHPDDREPTQVALQNALDENSIYDVFYRTRGPDGVERYIRAIGRGSYDENGRPYRIDGLTIDVSETYQADRALRLSESRYRSLVSATAAIVWTSGPKGEFLNPQEQWESYTGQAWEDYRGTGWRSALHPEDAKPLLADFLEAYKARGIYKSSGRLWHAPSASYRHFEVNGVPVLEGDEIQEWVGIVVDVHDRLASERMALESSLRLQAALNQSVGFIAVLSPEGEVLEINNTPLETSGHWREDVIGKLFWETPWWAGRPEAQEKLKADFQSAVLGEPARSESVYYLKDGTERVADRCFTASRGLDGEVAFVLAEGMDITERVRAENRVRLLAEGGKALSGTLVEEEMIEELFSQMTSGYTDVCVWDRVHEDEDKRIERSWKLAEDVPRGFSELLDRRPTFESEHLSVRVLKSGLGILGEQVDEAWLQSQGLNPEYARTVCDFGVTSIMTIPVKGRGRLLGVLTVALTRNRKYSYDHTDQKVMNELADRLGMALENARLYSQVSQSEQRFRNLSRELAEARDEALRADRMKSQFLANMSHEIRTPMAGVQGMLELLAATELSREQREFVDTVRDCSQSLLTVLDDVLDLARIDAGKMVIVKRPFQLAGAIKGVLSLFELQAQQRRLDLRVKLSEELPETLVSDPDRLRQLLVNLASNAMKFTHEGFVEIRVFPHGEVLRVEVEDSGIGIPQGKLDTLWKAFEQVDSSSSRRYEGAGLGLSIVKRLVELMDGELGVESEPGKGSTFWFTLPLKVAPDVVVQETVPAEPYRGEGQILVAEDNPINRHVLVKQLVGLGYEVLEARNGREVLESLKETSVDLIFMDCQMPELDGYSASRALREQGVDIPILALTAHAMSGERARCLEAGMDDHLTKPLAKNTLLTALRRWMPRSEPPVNIG